MRGRAVIVRAAAGVLAAAWLGVGAASAAPVQTGAHEIGFKWLGTTCVPAAGGTVRAKVRVRMFVVNHGVGKHWVDKMRVKVRLESGTGTSIHRSWRSQASKSLPQSGRHSVDFTVLSDTVKPTADWHLHVKLSWDRKLPWRDRVESFRSGRPLACATAGVGDPGLNIGGG